MARVLFAVLSLRAALATDETTASLRGSAAAAATAAAARRLGSCTADAKPCAAPGSNPAIWCFQDSSCPGGGYNGGQGCFEDSGCRYCNATVIGGPSYNGEQCPTPPPSLLGPAPDAASGQAKGPSDESGNASLRSGYTPCMEDSDCPAPYHCTYALHVCSDAD